MRRTQCPRPLRVKLPFEDAAGWLIGVSVIGTISGERMLTGHRAAARVRWGKSKVLEAHAVVADGSWWPTEGNFGRKEPQKGAFSGLRC